MAASAAIHEANRRRAVAAARPQWRLHGRVPVVVTNQRVVLMAEQVYSYELHRIVMIEPDPLHYAVALHFEHASPVLLRGPWVPWATVAVCATVFGAPWPPGFVPPPTHPPVQTAPVAHLPLPAAPGPDGHRSATTTGEP
jgi:hypothetical protein